MPKCQVAVTYGQHQESVRTLGIPEKDIVLSPVSRMICWTADKVNFLLRAFELEAESCLSILQHILRSDLRVRPRRSGLVQTRTGRRGCRAS